ncbi:MAG: transposase [Ardenticatenaceae bacterium]|nr:transposase [Ardenticatenaceae bacterium]
MGRSRGGFCTKIHVGVDVLGNPLRFILTPGQTHYSTKAEALMNGYEYDHVLADKSYDAYEILQPIAEQGTEAVILHRVVNRKGQREYDEYR